MPSTHQKQLENLGESARKELDIKHAAREQAYQLSRTTIRGAANTIRAIHRHELEQARTLLNGVAASVEETRHLLTYHPDLYHTGYVQDAQKEYVEANATLAFVAGEPVPTQQQLTVELPPYLNGIAEAASELRRYILDALRSNNSATCEPLMETMDEVYSLLVSLDFPEAITGGLRRTTDALRGVLERTRGDLTLALRQRSLEQQIAALEKSQSSQS